MSLQGKTREELFEIWRKRVRIARDLHKEKVVEWSEKILREYSGDSYSDADTSERYTQLAHIIHGIEETIQPHLMFQNPTVFVTAKVPQWEKREKLVAAVVNREYSDIKKTGHRLSLENELVVTDARLLPFGCTESTWSVKGGILEEKKPGLLSGMKSLITGSEEVTRTPVIEEEIGHVTERVNPLEVYLDYTAPHITKQKWFVRKKDLTKDELVNVRYDQGLVERMNANVTLSPGDDFGVKITRDKEIDGEAFKGYRVYEIHDLENRKIHTIAEGLDDFIEFDRDYPVKEGSTYSWLWFKEIPNKVYPIPPIKFYRKRASEFSYIYSSVSKQIDKFMPKIGIDVNKLHGPDKERFKAGGLGAIIGFDGPPAGGLSEISPRVQPDLINYLTMTKDLLNLESGVTEYEVEVPEKRTATEAAIMQRGAKARRMKPQKRVKDFIVNQAHIIWQLLVQNVSEEQFVKVLGENDALEWWSDPETGKQSWVGQDLAGDYWFDIDIESLMPMDKAQRIAVNNQALELLSNPNLKAQMLQEGTELLLAPMIEKIADENWGIKDKSRILRKLEGMEPSEEHDLWMQGQYPKISDREMKDPKFMQKHIEAHTMWTQSPAFQGLPPEVQQMAIQHLQSYQQMQPQKTMPGMSPGGNSSITEPFKPVPSAPSPAAVEEDVV